MQEKGKRDEPWSTSQLHTCHQATVSTRQNDSRATHFTLDRVWREHEEESVTAFNSAVNLVQPARQRGVTKNGGKARTHQSFDGGMSSQSTCNRRTHATQSQLQATGTPEQTQMFRSSTPEQGRKLTVSDLRLRSSKSVLNAS